MQNLTTETNIPKELRDLPFDEMQFTEILSGLSKCKSLEDIENYLNDTWEKEIFLTKL